MAKLKKAYFKNRVRYEIKDYDEILAPILLDATDSYYEEWKKGKRLSDRLVIATEGRSIWGGVANMNKDIFYSLYDFSTPPSRRLRPLYIGIVYADKGINSPVTGYTLRIPFQASNRYVSVHTAEILYKAVMAVDTEYTKPGGGMMVKHSFYNDPILTQQLRAELQSIVVPLP